MRADQVVRQYSTPVGDGGAYPRGPYRFRTAPDAFRFLSQARQIGKIRVQLLQREPRGREGADIAAGAGERDPRRRRRLAIIGQHCIM